MGKGAFVLWFVFQAIGSLLLMFPVAALAVRGHRKMKLSWGQGLALLGVTTLIVAIVNFVIYAVQPSLRYSREFSGLGMIVDFLIPLVVSVSILYMFWRPTPDPSGETMKAVTAPPNPHGIRFENGSYIYGSYRFDCFSNATTHARHVESLQAYSTRTPHELEGPPAPEVAAPIQAAPEPPIDDAHASIASESATLSIEQKRAVLAVIRSMKSSESAAPNNSFKPNPLRGSAY